MSKGKRLREAREAETAGQARLREIAGSDFSQKLAWSECHIDALDKSIQGWIDGGGYTFVDKPDPETGYHVLYAQIKDLSPDWPLMAGDAVHNLRSALDHIAYSLLRKIHGDPLPDDLAEGSEFPILGMLSRKRKARTAPDSDFDSVVGRCLGVIPSELREALRNLQPYMSGAQFETHDLWLIHHLDRVDKHRHLHLVTAAANLTEMSMGGTGFFPHFWFGGGITKDGDKVAEWADPTGPNPNLNVNIASEICLGEGNGDGSPLIPLLRRLRGFLASDVMPALAPYL